MTKDCPRRDGPAELLTEMIACMEDVSNGLALASVGVGCWDCGGGNEGST